MIRDAVTSDIPRLLEMGKRFADEAELSEHVGYAADDMAKTFGIMIDSPEHTILIGDNGAIGGLSSPHPFNHSHWIAQELFWWSEGREGLLLLNAFEKWAQRSCHSVRMITLEAVNPKRMGRLYQNRGYAPLEHGYIKVF